MLSRDHVLAGAGMCHQLVTDACWLANQLENINDSKPMKQDLSTFSDIFQNFVILCNIYIETIKVKNIIKHDTFIFIMLKLHNSLIISILIGSILLYTSSFWGKAGRQNCCQSRPHFLLLMPVLEVIFTFQMLQFNCKTKLQTSV